MRPRGFITLPRRALMLAIRAYRYWLSPWLGSRCRFEPSCSAYALQALEVHGAAGGLLLTGGRILRCQPWCAGGHDPVPAAWRTPSRGLFTRLLSPEHPSPDATLPPIRKQP